MKQRASSATENRTDAAVLAGFSGHGSGPLLDSTGAEVESLAVMVGKTVGATVGPLVAQLETRLQTAARRGPLQIDSVRASVFRDFWNCLGQLLIRTFVLELNVARLRGKLSGNSGEARLQDFSRFLSEDGGWVEVLREYPVLGRRLLDIGRRFADAQLECLDHFCQDWTTWQTSGLIDQPVGELVTIGGPAGDPHRSSRAVRILRLSSGQSIVYKPRSLSTDEQFQRALQFLNERGAASPFALLPVTTGADHGWQRYVRPYQCTSDPEIERFYRRQGGYLALFWLFNASDMHYGNVIAAGENPFIIDLETLGQPRQRRPNGTLPNEFSVLDVGFLPTRWRTESNSIIDVSGLAARQPSAATPSPVADVWTDYMRIQPVSPHIGDVHSCPTSHPLGQAEHHIDDIIDGFSDIYRILQAERRALSQPGHPLNLAPGCVRVVARPTRFYLQTAANLLHPDVLRDAADFEATLDVLSHTLEARPELDKLTASERRDLRAGDVPYFFTTNDSLSLFDSLNTELPDCLTQSSRSCFLENVGRLGVSHRRQQIRLIKMALQTLLTEQNPRAYRLPPSDDAVHPDILRHVATAAARSVVAMAAGDDRRAWWYNLEPRGEDWCVANAGIGLYDGAAGIALFLAQAGRRLDERAFTNKAYAALRTVMHSIATDPPQREIGLSGSGGLIFALTHLACVLDSRPAADLAFRLISSTAEEAAREEAHDLMAGSAGWIKGVLAFHRCWPMPETARALTRVGEALASHVHRHYAAGATSGRTGFAHGAAGVADALSSLSRLTRSTTLQAAAAECLAFERRHFETADQNWPTLRKGGTFESDPMVAWCYGAPGIALSRLTTQRAVQDPHSEVELALATAVTLRQGFSGNDSLCHGSSGNLDCLLTIATERHDAELLGHVKRIAASVCDTATRTGILCGHHAPGRSETPGLMTGVSGFGHTILRLLDPTMPSVLALDPPQQSAPLSARYLVQ